MKGWRAQILNDGRTFPVSEVLFICPHNIEATNLLPLEEDIQLYFSAVLSSKT